MVSLLYSEEIDFIPEQEVERLPYQQEDLFLLEDNPINLQTATEIELRTIPFLREEEVNKVIEYKHNKGISSFRDLALAGLSAKSIDTIAPYITFSNDEKIQGHGRLVNNWDCVTNTASWNNKTIMKNRYSSFSIQLQKDKTDKNAISDYAYSIRMQTNNQRVVLWLGKYKPRFGNGLLWGTTGFSSVQSALHSKKRNAYSISEYPSLYDLHCMQGIACNLDYAMFHMIVFLSNKDVHAKIDTLGHWVSLLEDERNPDLRERNAGIILSLSSHDISTAITGSSFNYSRVPSFINTKSISAFSIYQTWQKDSLQIDYELCRVSHKNDFLATAKWKQPNLSYFVLYRYYGSNIPLQYGQPYTQSKEGQSEEGILSMIQFHKAFIDIVISYDWWHNPMNSYNPIITHGNVEKALQLAYYYNSTKHKLQVSYKTEDATASNVINDKNTLITKYSFDCNLSENTHIIDLWEWGKEVAPVEYGYALAQMVDWNRKNWKISVLFCLYNSDVNMYLNAGEQDNYLFSSICGDGFLSQFGVKTQLTNQFKLLLLLRNSYEKENNTQLRIAMNYTF